MKETVPPKDSIADTQRNQWLTLWLWIRFNSIWLIAFAIALTLGVIWLLETVSFRENQVTELVDMTGYGVPGLEIEIQYPSRLTLGDGGNSPARRIIVLPKGMIDTSLEPVILNFQETTRSVNFTDSDGHIVNGDVTLPTENGRAGPIELYVVLADIERGRLEKVSVETSIKTQSQNEIDVPKLEMVIEAETPFNRAVRQFAQSAFGSTLTLLAMTTAITGFGWKQYRTRKRIRPYEIEIEHLNKKNQWEKVADLCHKIIEIDPLYDHIGNRYQDAWERAQRQRKQLDTLYREGKAEIQRKNWIEARQKLIEISQIRDDYHDVQNLIQLVELENEKEMETNRLLREAGYANIRGNLRSAIRCYQQILEIDPENTEATRALEEVHKAVQIYGTEQLTPETFESVAAMARLTVTDSNMFRQVLAQPELSDELITTIAKMSIQTRENMLHALRDERPSVRYNTVRVLAEIGDQQAYHYLQTVASEDGDPDVRQAAYQVLRQRASIKELIAGLSDPSTWTQVRPLILAKGTSAIPYLIPLLEQPAHIRLRVGGILFEMGEEAHEFLLQMLPLDNSTLQERIQEILDAWREEASIEDEE